MAAKRKQVTLDEVFQLKLSHLQEEYRKRKMQPPSVSQLANRAILKGIGVLTGEVISEFKK